MKAVTSLYFQWCPAGSCEGMVIKTSFSGATYVQRVSVLLENRTRLIFDSQELAEAFCNGKGIECQHLST